MAESLILRADARSLPLPDESVDLVVTSPPYFGLRSYRDGGEHYTGQLGAEASPSEFVDALIECTREMVRVLKPNGSVFINLGDKYSGAQGQTQTGINGRRHVSDSAATWRQTDPRRTGIPNKSLMLMPERYRIRCVDELGLIARAVIVWAKPNSLPESVTDRVRRSHEDWVHLTKQPRYYSAIDDIREPASGYARPNGAGREPRGGQKARKMLDTVNPRGRVPGSVWEIPTQPFNAPASLGVDHYAAFPMEWPRRLITGWCPPGGTVLDPFGGTGTTALVAAMLGRRGLSVDLSADYCRLATWRANDPKERARAAGTDPTKVTVPQPDQPDLFGGAA
ncbi:DNA-methyltransferase [Amycolatopsis circi]|uniref:DNA-methyltransferase n=1 Tax=Amycolatopsis circi TaxID=871959 RepID=UPI0013BE8B6B|nr:site-specific DNA-methyltransferase [Amycolatopsis circi]